MRRTRTTEPLKRCKGLCRTFVHTLKLGSPFFPHVDASTPHLNGEMEQSDWYQLMQQQGQGAEGHSPLDFAANPSFQPQSPPLLPSSYSTWDDPSPEFGGIESVGRRESSGAKESIGRRESVQKFILPRSCEPFVFLLRSEAIEVILSKHLSHRCRAAHRACSKQEEGPCDSCSQLGIECFKTISRMDQAPVASSSRLQDSTEATSYIDGVMRRHAEQQTTLP